MADFISALIARDAVGQDAMRKSVESLFSDSTLTESGRVDALLKNATDYAEHLHVPLERARGFVAKVASDAGAVPSIIRKVADPHGLLPTRREKLPHEKEDFSDINPDPNLVGEEDKPMKQSTKEAMLKTARADFANQVAKIQAENPHLTFGQARSIFYSQNPGLYKSMRKWAAPGDDLAKGQPSSAETEVAEKTAEIKKARPELTDQQAYTKAIEGTPGLMQRLLHGEA